MAAQQRRMVGGEAERKAVQSDELFERLLHDIRNPVGVIAQYAEVLSGAGAGERDEMCARLRINAQRALDILEEFGLLGDLRSGQTRPAPELCDVRDMIATLAADLEALERRPECVRSSIALNAPVALPPRHIACTLRALLRVAVRAASHQPIEIDVRAEAARLTFRLTVPLRVDSELGVASRLPTAGTEIELAEQVAALLNGRFELTQIPGRGVVVLAVKI